MEVEFLEEYLELQWSKELNVTRNVKVELLEDESEVKLPKE